LKPIDVGQRTIGVISNRRWPEFFHKSSNSSLVEIPDLGAAWLLDVEIGSAGPVPLYVGEKRSLRKPGVWNDVSLRYPVPGIERNAEF
jgi:hypothetical protein